MNQAGALVMILLALIVGAWCGAAARDTFTYEQCSKRGQVVYNRSVMSHPVALKCQVADAGV